MNLLSIDYPQQEGNMNGWLIEVEDEPLEHEASDREVHSDFESTASSRPMLKKIAKAILDRMFRNCLMVRTRHNNDDDNGQPNLAALITEQLQNIIPQIVTQVTTNVVTGTFSLNNHFATVLFDSGADFSFISTEFAFMLNVKPRIVNPGYVIEIADGKRVEVNRVICDCKLELGNSLFTIDLIPLGHGSFDVIVGMDWLSRNKAVIVCHEKMVEIPLEGGEALRAHGERALGLDKTLMNANVGEPKMNEIPIVREFSDVFL
ncbi:putative reverse transcriptase domain-containing protein [Tanacetum coccineum]